MLTTSEGPNEKEGLLAAPQEAFPEDVERLFGVSIPFWSLLAKSGRSE